MDLQVKKLKVDVSTSTRETSLSPVPIFTLRQRQITHPPLLNEKEGIKELGNFEYLENEKRVFR